MGGRESCPVIFDNTFCCRGLLDIKGFKGKGGALELLKAVRVSFEDCWREMLKLELESKHLQANAYLQVHRYPGLGRIPAVSYLRWRVRQSGSAHDSHTSWEQVEAMTAGLPPAVQRYYSAMNQRMLDLNCLAQVLQQTAIRLLLRLSDRNARQTGSGKDAPAGVQLFLAWVKGDHSTQTNSVMKQEALRSADSEEAHAKA